MRTRSPAAGYLLAPSPSSLVTEESLARPPSAADRRAWATRSMSQARNPLSRSTPATRILRRALHQYSARWLGTSGGELRQRGFYPELSSWSTRPPSWLPNLGTASFPCDRHFVRK